MKNIKELHVQMSQKINLGNYETRDIMIGMTIDGFDGTKDDEITGALEFGKERCIKEVGDYYRRIKKEMAEPKKPIIEISKEADNLLEKILSASNEEQLRALSDSIQSLEEKESQKEISKQFNLKLLSFKK